MIESASPARLNLAAATALLIGVVVVTLDISLTSTALPAISKGLGASPATTIWIVNIYYLAVVAALLPLASLGEVIGHERIFLIGLAAFGVGALASGMAGSLALLMAGRGLLGLGAAAVSATTPALIRSIWPPERMGRGLGLYAMVVGIAFSAGPSVASAVLAVADWPWLYFQAAATAFAAAVLGRAGLPPSDRSDRPFDRTAAALCAATFAFLLFAIAGAAHLGAGPALIALGASIVFAALLYRREAGSPAPLLAADLFRSPIFALSSATSVLAFTVQGLAFVVLPLLLHFDLGFSQVDIGLLIIPWPAALVVMSIIASRLSERFAPGALGCLGLAILSVGLLSLTGLSQGAAPLEIGWRLVVCGIGFGFFQSPNMVAIMSSAPRERSGGAGGILATSRLLGQSLGAAAVALCLTLAPDDGARNALWLGAILAGVASLVSLLRVAPAFWRREPT